MGDTEQLFLLAEIWTLIAVVIARFIPNWPSRIAFVAIAVGLPFWELPYGYYNFRQLCEAEAQLLVFEKISPQDSICVGDLDAGVYSGLTRAGFQKIEVTGKSDDLKRDIASGRVTRIARSEVRSKYCLIFNSGSPLPWRVHRSDVLIAKGADGKIVARQSGFSWAGMWWQEHTRPIFGRGGACFDDPLRPNVALRNGTS